MRIASIDKGFVRAAPERVYEMVLDPARYPAWWPKVRTDGQERIRFPLLGSVAVSTEVVAAGVEMVVRLDGPRVRGHLLWYLEPFKDGTIVHVATDVETRRRWTARRVLRHRASMRDACAAMKRRLE